jgi:DNA end-binding protein Ku
VGKPYSENGRRPIMARAIWSGAISFGLVSVPVKLYSATEQKDVAFNQFQRETGRRIRYKRVAEETGREVDYEDIDKGYEVSKGEFVMVTPEELESVELGRSRTIEIREFVDLEAIDPIHYEKTYYLAPEKDAGAERPYTLLHRAMEESGRVAIASFVMRTKQYLAAVRPKDGILVLETMFFPDEIRSVDEIDELPVRARVEERQLRVARQLIDSLAEEWDPSRYHDEYRERVLKLIRDKAKGKEIVVPERPETPEVGDLMAALQASIQATREGRRVVPEDEGREEGRPSRGRRRRRIESLQDWTKERLLDRAAELDVKGRSRMNKDQLVRAVRRAS